MKTIWKYDYLPLQDEFSLEMPKGAQILTLQLQNDEATIWALVEPTATQVKRKFAWVGTGHSREIEIFKQYIGTIQVCEGKLVFHLFDLGEAKT